MKLWFCVAGFIASFTVLMWGQEMPKLSPAEAARVMQGPAMQSNVTHRLAPLPAAGPSVVVKGTPGSNSWMPFPPPTEQKRLDGTPISQPPAVYGPPFLVIHGRR